jgi:hypothetical protein
MAARAIALICFLADRIIRSASPGIALVFSLLVVAVGIPAVLFFASRIGAEPSVEIKVAHSVDQLKAIAAQEPMRIDATPDWTRQALTRLYDLKESVETAESIARDVERQLAEKSSGCIFAKTDGGAVNKEITPAWTATKNALDTLLSEAKDRIKHLTDENTTLGWTGWRGSREEQISELWVLAHAIEATTAEAGLAFYRLNDNTTALNKMSFTCSSP